MKYNNVLFLLCMISAFASAYSDKEIAQFEREFSLLFGQKELTAAQYKRMQELASIMKGISLKKSAEWERKVLKKSDQVDKKEELVVDVSQRIDPIELKSPTPIRVEAATDLNLEKFDLTDAQYTLLADLLFSCSDKIFYKLESDIGSIVAEWDEHGDHKHIKSFKVLPGAEKQSERDRRITIINRIVLESVDYYFDKKKYEILNIKPLRAMIFRMIVNMFSGFYTATSRDTLSWCPCTNFEDRLLLAIRVILDVRKKYSDGTQLLRYASFASGNLLQDYVILSELMLTHSNLLIDIIDYDYEEINSSLKHKKGSNRFEIHKKNLALASDIANTIDYFKVALVSYVSQWGKSIINLDANFYGDAYSYIIKRKGEDKKKLKALNILICVDPNNSIFPTRFPSNANCALLYVADEKTDAMVLLVKPFTVPKATFLVVPKDHTIDKVFEKEFNLFIQKRMNEMKKDSFAGASIFMQPALTKFNDNKNGDRLKELKDRYAKKMYSFEDISQEDEPSLMAGRIGEKDFLILFSTEPELTYQDLVNALTDEKTVMYELVHSNEEPVKSVKNIKDIRMTGLDFEEDSEETKA